jgi:hypothetical protein
MRFDPNIEKKLYFDPNIIKLCWLSSVKLQKKCEKNFDTDLRQIPSPVSRF